MKIKYYVITLLIMISKETGQSEITGKNMQRWRISTKGLHSPMKEKLQWFFLLSLDHTSFLCIGAQSVHLFGKNLHKKQKTSNSQVSQPKKGPISLAKILERWYNNYGMKIQREDPVKNNP